MPKIGKISFTGGNRCWMTDCKVHCKDQSFQQMLVAGWSSVKSNSCSKKRNLLAEYLKSFLTYKKEFISIGDDKSKKMEFLHLTGKRRKPIGEDTYRNFFKKIKIEKYYGDN